MRVAMGWRLSRRLQELNVSWHGLGAAEGGGLAEDLAVHNCSLWCRPAR